MQDNFKVRPLRHAVALSMAVHLLPAHSQDAENINTPALPRSETMVEQIVVTSALHRSRADTVLPVNVLAGDELREKVAATLGDMLESQVGVNNASFGTGVGLPVIRGQSANRVQVLQMGVGNLDASAVSPDHANSLEPALAERIEVIRGPATLLYGNGAIGGVVNVIDGRIPREPKSPLTALVETRYDSVSDQRVGVLKLEGGLSQFAWHLDAVDRESNDTTISGFAINPDTVDLDDPVAHQQLLDSRGRLANSAAASDSWTAGGSWLYDGGWLGLAYNELNNDYGLPPGVHVHHDEDEDHDHEDGEDMDDEENANIRIAMAQQRWDLEGRVLLNTSGVSELHGKMSKVDYRHLEVEGDGAIGTVFENQGIEGRFTAHLQVPSNLEGVVGMQFSDREFAATGAEAFIPKTDIRSLALFTLQSLDQEQYTLEFGLRAEQQDMDQAGSCDHAVTNYSGSAAAIWRVSDRSNLLFSFNHSQRAASVEERYSNIAANCSEQAADSLIVHQATRRVEIGLPDAGREQSNNFEFGWRKYAGDVTAEINVFYNDISEFIYLFDTGSYVDDVEIARYQQTDAVFKGMELEISLPLYATGSHKSDLTLFSDFVDAEFGSAGNVPRIPPLRWGAEWVHSHVNWMLKLRWTQVAAQNDLAINETRTGAYQLLSLYGDYQMQWGNNTRLLLFARGHNLLDENIRQHTSLLKDVAPAPGRGVEVGLRLEF